MSTFSVNVSRIVIEPHPNADALELGRINDFVSVVRKGQYQTGDLVVYIPEAAVVPEWILKEIGLWNDEKNIGRLAGPTGTRVKAVKLRNELSQGLVYPVDYNVGEDGSRYHFISIPTNSEPTGYMLLVNEGQDVATELGITKYEPPIPIKMAGEIYNAGIDITVNYDIENLKKYNDIFKDNEDVVITEKLHGTFVQIGIVPESMYDSNHYEGRYIVSSKGLGANGLAFKHNERNTENVYLRIAREQNVFEKLYALYQNATVPVFLLGEIFGTGIQDLSYGQPKPILRCFDICIGTRSQHKYVNSADLVTVLGMMEIPQVPVLYTGPYSKSIVDEYTNGDETLSGSLAHIREGVVIKPVVERTDSRIGRVILKSVSVKYLLRKGGTEFN